MKIPIRNFAPSAINPLVTHTDQIILEFPELEDMLSPKAADNHSEGDLESNNVVESSDEKQREKEIKLRMPSVKNQGHFEAAV